MSIITNLKRYTGNTIKNVAKNYQSRMDARKKKMDEEVKSMGYKDISQVNKMNTDMPSEDIITRGVKKVVRGVKNTIKRYGKK
jgi:hypothetical protein